MKQIKLFAFFIVICITVSYKSSLFSRDKGLQSIDHSDFFSLIHYPKFFGDKNTIHGKFCERSYLVPDFLGIRSSLVERGVYVNTTIFQFLGSNLGGGEKDRNIRYNVNADYSLIIDTAKVGLWSRGAFVFRLESAWTVDDSINDDVGSILAANSKSRIPVPGHSQTTLSEIVLKQYLSDSFSFRIGKMDATGPIDATTFANNSRYQFTYAGLSNNPIISHFAAYTTWGVLPVWKLDKKNELLFFLADSQGKAERLSLRTKLAGCFQYTFSPTINKNLPGNYRMMCAYSKKPIRGYELDRRHMLEKYNEAIPVTKNSNYALLVNFDQYLWVNSNNENIKNRHDLPPVGILLFGRAGWEPKNRNVIDHFYSIGIGSYGGLGKRYYDSWGIGYAATHISDSFRKDLKKRSIHFGNFEHAFEAFYNIKITPALNFTINAQVIKSPVDFLSKSFVINSRLQADF